MGLDDFYTLPKIHDSHVDWQPQIDLYNYIQSLNQSLKGLNEVCLAYYLFKKLQTNPHDEFLIKIWQSWLAKLCLIVTQRMQRKLSSYFKQYELADLFQYCYLPVLNPVNFFSPFKFDYSEKDFYSALKSYCYSKLKLCFYDTIRKKLNNNNIGITDRGLAVRCSGKKWREVAKNSLEIDQFNLLWSCVNESKNIQNPCHKWTEEKFNDIGDRYNELRRTLEPINGKIVKKMLEKIGKEIRLLENPIIQSIDEPVNSEYQNKTLIDTISAPVYDHTYNEEISQLNEVIDRIINRLNPQEKNLAFIYFYLGLNQQETARELSVNQSRVSRFGARIFTEIANQFNQNGQIKPTSEDLKFLKETINEFYYDRQINLIVENNLSLNLDSIIDQIQIEFTLELTDNAKNKLTVLVVNKIKYFSSLNCA